MTQNTGTEPLVLLCFFPTPDVTAGTDDFLNSWQAGRYPGGPKFAIGQDVFFGGGIVFTDDDLKAIIGAAGSAVTSGAANAR